jgi:deazaflavin-dependent oxidoreductase (nitroreductase family)
MPLSGEYEPSPAEWTRKQVELYESTGGREGNLQRPTGLPVVIVTMRGKSSGKLRKVALMRVEHDGEYALVGSKGGAPTDPVWVGNLKADPHVTVQDGPEPVDMTVRLVTGDERKQWWQRCVDAFPNYADYERKTSREIPVFVATPMSADEIAAERRAG